MKRLAFLICIIFLLVALSGCRNRCNNCLGWGNPRIPVPPTYSYNANNAQPYYNPTAANPNTNIANPNLGNPSLSPGGTQAIPASGPTSIPVQPGGWRPTQPPGNATSIYNQPNDGSLNTTSFYTAQPGTFTGAPNYSTTSVDETRDPTRMPASDATAVRAPANFNPQGNWAMNTPQRSINVPGSYEYHTRPQLTRNDMNQFQTQPVINPNGFYSTPNRSVVLAQSSTVQDPRYNPNTQAGWRNRTEASTNVNR